MQGTEKWRLLVDGPLSGVENMARDEALALHADNRATLRAYRFEPVCVTIGRFQPLPGGIDPDACAREGIDVVRRPTGGLAILHRFEFTYSVVAPMRGPGPAERDRHFDEVASAIIGGLARIGVRAAQGRHGDSRSVRGAWCFEGVFGVDLEWRGRKICGSAQRVFARSVLQHGSLFLDDSSEILGRISFDAGTAGDAPPFATVREAAAREVTWDGLLDALVASFEDTLGMGLEPGRMTDDEKELSRRLAREKYAAEKWLLSRREPAGGAE